MKKFVLAILLSVTIASLIWVSELAESSAFGLEFRTIDGSGNNIANSQWGQAGQPLERLLQNGYDDGLSVPRGGTPSSLPSARVVSNFVSDQNVLMPDPNGVNNMFWDFGQFIDHDIDLTGAADPQEPFNIPVPIDDPVFNGPVIPVDRSVYVGDGIITTRQQLNGITAYIDASNVYSSDTTRADYLREFDGSGKLKTSLANNGEVLLPFNLIGLPNAGGPMPTLFIAGDVRANEQVGLTALHILFVREHNRIADDLATRLAANEPALVQKLNDSGLSQGDFIYESARALVGAQIQIITYEEFLPMLLGPGSLSPYGGYDSSVNSQIANSFSTAAYRFGHTMVSPELTRLGDSPVPIATAFFNPQLLVNDGADSLLGGMGLAAAQEVDTQIIDGLRNFLFGPGSGLDLASLNIQRGRDHGLPSYNDARDDLSGISPVADFLEMTGGDAILEAKFASAYTNVNDVDLWAGGLAEPTVNGGMVGETFFLILVDQFEKLRDGDRFFYLNNLSHLEIFDPYLEHTSLSKIIQRNTVMESMPDNMFIVPFNAVGGEIIPIDKIALLLAGAQMTSVWLIPIIVAGIGIGIVVARKF